MTAAAALLAYSTALFTILFCGVSAFAALKYKLRAARAKSSAELPAVSVLKPLKGDDGDEAQMYANLATFLTQNYPRYQVLFALQSPEPLALKTLQRLRQDFPSVDMEVVISKNKIGFNPKINNLANAYPLAKHDVLLISDSDIRVEADFLRRAVTALSDPKVGMATCFYRSTPGSGITGALEALAVNGHFLPQALVASQIGGLRFAMGAAMLLRRSVFEECGGFQRLARHLADDFVLGEAVAQAGYDVAFADPMVDSVPEISRFTDHLAHLARWARTIRVCNTSGYAGLIALQGFTLMTIYLALGGYSTASLAVWSAVFAARALSFIAVQSAAGTRDYALQVLLIPVSDCLQFFSWLAGFHSTQVRWRGELYSVERRGLLTPKGPHQAAPKSPALI